MAPSSPGPELSSIATAVADLARRVTAIAEAATGPDAERLAGQLFDVERSLGEAGRRLATLTATLRTND